MKWLRFERYGNGVDGNRWLGGVSIFSIFDTMTLIVARKYKNQIQVDSDTITMNPLEASTVNPSQLITLKSIILDREISVSFAGDVEKAQKVIRQIFELNDFRLDTVKAFLLNANIDSDNHVEFIVAHTAGSSRILKISDKKIYEGDDIYWIGDSKAFYEFRRYVFESEREVQELKSEGTFVQEGAFTKQDDESLYDSIFSPIAIQSKAFEKVVGMKKLLGLEDFMFQLSVTMVNKIIPPQQK